MRCELKLGLVELYSSYMFQWGNIDWRDHFTFEQVGREGMILYFFVFYFVCFIIESCSFFKCHSLGHCKFVDH